MARSIEELVDRQMRRWALGHRASSDVPPRPCIALSRLPGAGAADLGRRVAEALDYTFFGIEIVDWIARSTGLTRQLVAGVDERIRNAIDRSVADSFRSERFTETDYLRHVVRVVTSLGEQGSAVILGRGSPFILPPERALRALVVAPPGVRAENLAKQRALPLERARELLGEEDSQRLQFLRHHFGRHPDDPIHYDLVLNLGTLSQEAAARLLIDALAARFPRSAGPKRAAPGA